MQHTTPVSKMLPSRRLGIALVFAALPLRPTSSFLAPPGPLLHRLASLRSTFHADDDNTAGTAAAATAARSKRAASAIRACGSDVARAVALLRASKPAAGSAEVAAAIDVCGRARQWEQALELVDEATSAAAAVASNRVGASESLEAVYHAAISACGACGEPDRALALLAAMQLRGVRPRRGSWGAAVSALGRAGRWQGAVALLAEMEAADLPDKVDIAGREGGYRHREGPLSPPAPLRCGSHMPRSCPINTAHTHRLGDVSRRTGRLRPSASRSGNRSSYRLHAS